MKFFKSAAAAFLSSATLAAGQNIIETATSLGNFSTLVAAIDAAGLTRDFTKGGRGASDYTVFAPTDTAFSESLPPGAVRFLLKDENVGLLTQVVEYHVVEDAILLSADLMDGQEVVTLSGATLAIGVDNMTVTVNNVTVSSADVEADKGVIHVIDQVLLPPDLVLPPSIVDIATSGDYPTLVAALGAADLVATLSGEGPFTVFAPTEEAFAKLPTGALEFLLRNPDILKEILLYHVVAGEVLSPTLADGQVVSTLLTGASLTVSIDGATGVVMINGAAVVAADNIALNGVVHVIDTVLIPAGVMLPPSIVDIATDGNYSTLAAALVAADLVDALSGAYPLTVFAPSEDAFAKLPTGALEFLLRNPEILKEVLLYHVVAGEVLSPTLADGQVVSTLLTDGNVTVSIDGAMVMINGAAVVGADNIALNGVVHVIDTVLIPPGVMFPPSIVDIATSGDYPTLVAALVAADLVATLSGEGPFTVFAPTEEAFADLPTGALEFLLRNPEILKEVLLYHVAGGNVLSSALNDGQVVPTLLADASVSVSIDIYAIDETVMINAATVVFADNIALNGVVHVIDTVLIPPGVMITPSILDMASGDAAFSMLSSLIVEYGLFDTLSGAGPFTVFAPTDDAFDAVPEALAYYLMEDDSYEILRDLLTYHVASDLVLSTYLSDGDSISTSTLYENDSLTISKMGATVMVNDVTITIADVDASNGVIQIIDKVLVPSSLDLPTLIDVASADALLSTLVVAVKAAELVVALSGPGPFTLFGPNDDAFGLLPAGTVKTLTEDEDKDPLKDILLYHVVEELITAEIVLDEELTSVTTMQGANLTLSVMDDGTTLVVNGTPVLGTIVTSNGIGHLIGVVLIPPVEATETTMAPVTVTTAPVSAPTSAPVEMDGALTTSTVVAALVSAAALLMV